MAHPDIELLSKRAIAHVETGNWDAARADWLAALRIAPDPAGVMLELSYVESLAGRYRGAREWALRAAAAGPRSAEAMSSLVKRLRTFNESAALHDFAAGLRRGPGAPHGVLVECAMQLSNLNDFDLALRCAQAAMAKSPADPAARLVRGQLLASHGRTEQAAEDFDATLARNPRVATAWWMLARLRKQTPESNHVARLRALLATPGIRRGDIALLARALHKELDDIGDHAGAWAALQLLCRTVRPTLGYDVAHTRKLFDALSAWVPGESPQAFADPSGPTPVFIVGMHRSGTTLLEQMLDASPGVRALGELQDFTSAMRYATDHACRFPIDATIVERAATVDFTEVGGRYMDGVAWRLAGESRFTDKQPVNFLNVGFICRALPGAKILHMVRDPVETCFSNLRELFSGVGEYSYDQLELADYHLQYRRLMAHWHSLFPGRILDVDYAQLTADPGRTMREVAAFCGIDYVDGMRSTASSKRAVGTASGVQVREEVAPRAVPKWQPYAAYLQPLRDALARDGA